MIPALLLVAILTARFLPDSAFGAWLNAKVMHPLATLLIRIERKHVIFAIAMTLIVLFAGEVLAMAGPLDAGLVFVWDVSVYLDIAIAGLAVAATTRGMGWKTIKPSLASLAARLRRKPVARARRTRRTSATPPANDDDGHGAERRAA